MQKPQKLQKPGKFEELKDESSPSDDGDVARWEVRQSQSWVLNETWDLSLTHTAMLASVPLKAELGSFTPKTAPT